MRIALIAHALRSGGGVSVGKNLIAAIGRLAPNNDYFVSISPELGYEEICALLNSCQVCAFSGGTNLLRRMYYENFKLPSDLKKFKPDIILGLSNKGVSNIKIPHMILLHNPYLWHSNKYYKNFLSFRDQMIVAIYKKILQSDIRKSKLLICQTKTAEKHVRETYHYDGKILICPNAFSDFIKNNDSVFPIPGIFNGLAGKKILFYLTAYYSHKNLEILIDLFHQFRNEMQDYVIFITISEIQHKKAANFLSKIKKYNLQDKIINIGPLAQEELPVYYSNCHALLMPTLLESYSGTYLEAMYFGLPILTSDLDFAREICGDYASYFDPYNAESIMKAIKQLDDNKFLKNKKRERLEIVGNSWNRIAANILQAIDNIVKIEKSNSMSNP